MREISEKERARELADRCVGRTLRNKWQIERLIGMGGMANVYAARHRNGRQVAIKMLHPEFAVHAEVRERFLREGYIANRIEHPAVVGILDDDETDDGVAFLVMELLRGESLHERLGILSVLPLAEALFIADQLLDVLKAAHQAGVVHRDIKPGNVFLLQDGRVKVLDFGLARVLDGQAQILTSQGIIMGTVSFMSPEQAKATPGTVDHRADLYSVAATLFHALSGEYVHPARTVMERLSSVMSKEARSIATVLPNLPPRVIACVDRALRSNRDERWPDAAAMQQEVRQAFHEATGSQIPETRRRMMHGMPGWARPASPLTQRDTIPEATTDIDISVVLEPEASQQSLNISVVFEPESSQESLGIPIEIDTSKL